MASTGGIRAGRAFVELGVLMGGLEKGLKQAEAKVRAFGKVTNDIGKAMFAGGASVAAPLVAAGKAYAEVGSAIARASQKTGASAESISTLGYAAQQSGAEMGSLEKGLAKMQKNLAEARGGSKQAAEAFTTLGISVEDLKGMTPDEQFKALADKIAQVADPADRAHAAMAIFGKGAEDLMPLLAQGGAGIDQMQARARALGLEMSGGSAKGALKLEEALNDLQDVTKAIAVAIGSAVAPVLEEFAARATHVAMEVRKWVEGHKELFATAMKVAAVVAGVGAALMAVGGAAGLMAPAIGAIGAVIGTLAAPVLGVAAAVTAIGAALAYAVGTGDTFGQRFTDGLGKIVGFLDEMGGSWSGFTNGMLTIWHQVVGKMKGVWIELKGWLSGAWNTMKTEFPDVVYGWAGAMAEFATAAWGVMKGLAVRIKNLWESVVDVVSNAMAEHQVKGQAEEDVRSLYGKGKVLTASDAKRMSMAEVATATAGMPRDTVEDRQKIKEKQDEIQGRYVKEYAGRSLSDDEIGGQVEKETQARLADLAAKRHAANADRDKAFQQSLADADAGTNKTQEDIEAWRKRGQGMSREQHLQEGEAQKKAIEDEKRKNEEETQRHLQEDLAKQSAMPKLSDAIKKAWDSAKDFFAKGPELPKMPEIEAAGDGIDAIQKKMGAVGTFSARAAGMLAGGHMEKLVKNSETQIQVAKEIKEAILANSILTFGP